MTANLSNGQKKNIKSVKAKFFLVLIVFISVISNSSAQIIRIEEVRDDDKGDSSICGHIENEQLTIPSYKFRVTDKNGTILRNLRAESELIIEEGIWRQNGFFDFDPYWDTINHNIKIPIIYDPEENVYISQEVKKVPVARRRKRLKKCLDKITKLHVFFYQNDCDSTGFIFFFPNRTIDKINLPDAEKVYNLGIITGYSCVKEN